MHTHTHLCARADSVRFIENKNKEILRLNGIYKNMLTNAGVELIDGYAKLVDAHTVDIDGKKVSFLPPSCVLSSLSTDTCAYGRVRWAVGVGIESKTQIAMAREMEGV